MSEMRGVMGAAARRRLHDALVAEGVYNLLDVLHRATVRSQRRGFSWGDPDREGLAETWQLLLTNQAAGVRHRRQDWPFPTARHLATAAKEAPPLSHSGEEVDSATLFAVKLIEAAGPDDAAEARVPRHLAGAAMRPWVLAIKAAWPVMDDYLVMQSAYNLAVGMWWASARVDAEVSATAQMRPDLPPKERA